MYSRNLAAVASEAGIAFAYDLGSGLLERVAGVTGDEPSAAEALAAGAGVVTFSGDKLLGGPQAGIAAGRADLIARLRKHPLARPLRVDKMQVAALEAVLHLHAAGRRGELPVWRMLTTTPAQLRRRARAVAAALGGEVVRAESAPGGGSLPGHAIESWAVSVPWARPDALAAKLRSERPTVFARVDEGAVLLDLRTVDPGDDDTLTRAVRYARDEP